MTAVDTRTTARTAISARLGRLPWDLYAALAATAVFAVAAIWPQLLATHGPLAMDLADTLRPPSAAHWFGTDESGRDLYTRVVHGTATSLTRIGATAVSLSLAVLLGALAALGPAGVGGRRMAARGRCSRSRPCCSHCWSSPCSVRRPSPR